MTKYVCVHPKYIGVLRQYRDFFTIYVKDIDNKPLDLKNIKIFDGVTKELVTLEYNTINIKSNGTFYDIDIDHKLCNGIKVKITDETPAAVFVYYNNDLVFNVPIAPVLTFADYYVPKELSVILVNIKKIIIIGPCIAGTFSNLLKSVNKDLEIEHVHMINIVKLPFKDKEYFKDVDLILVLPPMRTLMYKFTDYQYIIENENMNIYTEEVYQSLTLFLTHALEYTELYNVLTVVSTFISTQSPPEISYYRGHEFRDNTLKINFFIKDFIKNYKNTYLLDMDHMSSVFGKMGLMDDTNHFDTHNNFNTYSLSYPVEQYHRDTPSTTQTRLDDYLDHINLYGLQKSSTEFIKGVNDVLVAIKKIHTQVDTVKLVVFDLDNTLWRGVISENTDGKSFRSGWPQGLHEAIKCLQARGIGVCIVSKNDYNFIDKNIRKLTPFTLKDFVSVKINYKPKSVNIAEIIKETNILEHNILFVDDNPRERAEVLHAFPKIRTIGSEIYTLKRVILWSPETQILRHTNETLNKTALLKATINNNTATANASKIDFLNSLKLKIKINKINDTNNEYYQRCFELLNKTDQFNLNSIRLSENDFLSYIQNDNVYYIHAADKNVDYGVVSVIIYTQQAVNESITVQCYVMSCRVIGLDIEYMILKYIQKHNKKIHFKFVRTELNSPMQYFIETICSHDDNISV